MIARGFVAVVVTLVCLPAFASTTPAKINIGYATAADYLPAFVSKENGCFTANGIDAQFTRMPVTTNIPAMKKRTDPKTLVWSKP